MRSKATDWSPVGLDEDPTPGDVEAVDWRTKDFQSTAQWLWYRADKLTDVLEQVGEPHWSGYAATMFAERLQTVSTACRETSKRFNEARDASNAWCSVIWAQQGVADAALREAEDALEDIATAEATISSLTVEQAALHAALSLLERTYKQYATTAPPAGTRVPTGFELAAARRQADDANIELSSAQRLLEDAQDRLAQAKRNAATAAEYYHNEEGVFRNALEATLHGAMPTIAPTQLTDFVTTVTSFAKIDAPAMTGSALANMLTTLTPGELALLLARDPALIQKFWDNPPPAEKTAAWWKKLSPELREQWCKAAPEIIGNLPGLDADTRIHANAIQLKRDLDDPSTSPDSVKGKTLADILAALGIQKTPGATAADYEALAKRQKPARGLLSYNLRHTPPLAAVAIGDTRAEASGKVTWMVPGMDSGLGEPGRLSDWTEAGANLYNEQKNVDGSPHMVVAWIGYDPPVGDIGNTEVLNGDKAKKGGSRLSAELDGQWAASSILGGNPHPYTAVAAHSYGTTLVSNALRELTHNVQSVVFVASAGVEGGYGTLTDLDVDGGAQHVYATQSADDDVADKGRFGSGRVDPRDYRYGARVYYSDGNSTQNLEPVDGHDALGRGTDNGIPVFRPHASENHGYFDKDTKGLHNTAAATLGADDRIDGSGSPAPHD